jgi:hypothetical protein
MPRFINDFNSNICTTRFKKNETHFSFIFSCFQKSQLKNELLRNVFESNTKRTKKEETSII